MLAKTTGPERIIDQAQLALVEQYRFVTYAPSARRPIDWSHEREWRWPLRDASGLDTYDLPPVYSDIHGLELDDAELGGLGVIVQSQDQAEGILYDILMKIDRGDISQDHYLFVLPIDEVDKDTDLQNRDDLNTAIADAAVDVFERASISNQKASKLTKGFRRLVEHVEKHVQVFDIG